MLPVLVLKQDRKGQAYKRWLDRLHAAITNMTWPTVASYVAAHALISYLLLALCNESDITALPRYIYWYVVTASTVGYGDYSPTSAWGMMVVSFFIIPGGITIFTAIVGKAVSFSIEKWRAKMNGLKDYSDRKNHILILGWNGIGTQKMIEQIRGDERDAREIIVMDTLESNPLADMVDYVRAKTLNEGVSMLRAGAAGASVVIIHGNSDAEALGVVLVAAGLYEDTESTPHIVVYFQSQESAEIIKRHCKNVECVVSMSIEATVQAAQDPGSYELISQLMNNLQGQTQYRLVVPDNAKACQIKHLIPFFRSEYQATIIGVRDRIHEQLTVNPGNDVLVSPGDSIHLIAAERICGDEINWSALC